MRRHDAKFVVVDIMTTTCGAAKLTPRPRSVSTNAREYILNIVVVFIEYIALIEKYLNTERRSLLQYDILQFLY